MNDSLSGRYTKPKTFKESSTAALQTAEDLHSHQTVMLKFAAHPQDTSERERIKREARAYQLLDGAPGLPKFISYEENEGHPMGPFFAMELLDGNTLYKHLREGAFPESKAIAVGRALCKVLEKIHARGVIHRDISINNVFLSGKDQAVRLIDFGLALVPNEAGVYDSYDIGRVGTRSTRAPEVVASFPGDARSDIYSVGQLLYQMANGLKTQAVQKMPGMSTRAVSRVSDALSEVIACCLHEDPNDRYQSASELDRALARITAQAPGKNSLATKRTTTSRWAGALLLVGVSFPFTLAKLLPETVTPPTPTSEETPRTTTTTLPTSKAVVVVEKAMQPEPTTNKQAKQKAVKPKEATSPAPVKEEEEFEIDPELLEFATRPVPVAKPRPIELRVETKGKK